ncbi:MAG: hypothetical protein NT096_09420 [Proteobacteria bacterium]|nr:hypothetical protein [Pseudomonadota bacterium]
MKRYILFTVLFSLVFFIPALRADEFTVEPTPFSPNASPDEKDTLEISGTISQTVPVQVSIQGPSPSTQVVKTIPYSSFDYTHGYGGVRGTWDGKNDSNVFVSDGTYSLSFSTLLNKTLSKGNQYGDHRGMFKRSVDVAIGDDGKIYVLDTGVTYPDSNEYRSVIQVFDSSRNYLFSIQNTSVGQPGYLDTPKALAIKGSKLYVLDAGYNADTVKVFEISGNSGTYSKAFGKNSTSNTGDGYFNLSADYPSNLAIDSQGRVWVVDTGNNRVQVFDANGNFSFKFGSEGTTNGKFSFSGGGYIAFDSSDNAYVADTTRIQVFDSSGNYSKLVISYYTSMPPQVKDIGAIAVDGTGNYVYIASDGGEKVVILKKSGTPYIFYKQFGKDINTTTNLAEPGRGSGEFAGITSLHIASNKLYTVESRYNQRVQVFDLEGVYSAQLGMSTGEFLEPKGITVGPDGNVYVADYGNYRIQKFNSSGTFQLQILIPFDSSLLTHPETLAVDSSGNIYSCGDDNRGVLKVFDSSGNLITSEDMVDEEGDLFHPGGIAVIGNYVYISAKTWPSGKVCKFNKSGIFQSSFGSFDFEDGLGGMAVYQSNLYVLDKIAKEGTSDEILRVQVFNSSGTQTGTINLAETEWRGYHDEFASIAIDSLGNIYIVHNYPYEDTVFVYNQSGEFLYKFGETDDDSSSYFVPHGIAADSSGNFYLTDYHDDSSVTSTNYSHRFLKYNTNSSVTLGTASCEVDNTLPTATITYPTDNAVVGGSFSATGTASDKNFDEYRVELNSSILYTGTSPVQNGILAAISLNYEDTYTIQLTVWDTAGNENTDEVTFYYDASAPVSYVKSLSSYQNTASFPVEWSGYDSGSGVATYDVQYRDGENGTWTDWLTNTTLTSSTFTGSDGHTYYFRCRAKDKAGVQESYPSDYDTHTMVDLQKPVFGTVKPPSGAYVGDTPKITVEVSDPEKGSGIDTSTITVTIDGTPLTYHPYSDGKITITPATPFSKSPPLHTVVVNISDLAGNAADTLTLSYNALNFDGTVTTLSPDPNPATSEIMPGGTVYRYYKVLDKNGNPAVGVSLTTTWNKNNTGAADSSDSDASDENGIVAVGLDADLLGTVNDTPVNCTITAAGGNAITPTIPFDVDIIPRESTSHFKFGSGINLAGAVGVGVKVGVKKGFEYSVMNTDPSSSTNGDIDFERSHEMEVGVYVGADVGGGVKGACYASAGAKIGESLMVFYANKYHFDDPGSTEQEILRSGLIVAALMEQLGIPEIDLMLSFVIESYNEYFNNYMNEQKFSAGIKAWGEANAGAGLGLGDDKNVFLGIGVGAGIEGDYQIMGEFSTFYDQGDQRPDAMSAGISYAGSIDLSAGVEGGIVSDKVKAGIGANAAGEYRMTLFADSTGITKGEISFKGEKDWGVTVSSSFYEPGSTSTTKIILNRDQLTTLASDLLDLTYITDFINGSTKDQQSILGPSAIRDKLNALCNHLADMNFEYEIEEEDGLAINIEPSLTLALVIEVEAGVSIDIEKSVTFTKEKGIIAGAFGEEMPFEKYELDDHVPSPEDLDFTSMFQDLGESLWDVATSIVDSAIDTVVNTTVYVYNWVAEGIEDLFAPPLSGSAGRSSRSGTYTGVGRVFMFITEGQPEGLAISELSSELTSPHTITNGNCTLTINPGATTAQITISYSDSEVSGLNEGSLVIFGYDTVNRKWAPLSDSQVDTANNRVTASTGILGKFALAVPLPFGDIVLHVTPQGVDKNALSTITVTSDPIKLSNGNTVSDGTLVTVSSLLNQTTALENFGTITTTDKDTGTPGVQVTTSGGTITFQIMPPSTEGSGLITAETVQGTASGKATFAVITDIDADGNGLPDWWELQYFGTTGQSASADADSDGLTNLEEYQNRTDPTKADTDADGMPDGWEVDNKLNPLLDDANLDADNDTYTNLQEYLGGSDPQDPNSIPGECAKWDDVITKYQKYVGGQATWTDVIECYQGYVSSP